MRDPNFKVNGKGYEKLHGAGIGVLSGVLENEARELNVGYVSVMTRGRPWVRMKIAASFDGKTALNNGQSQWITGQAARDDGHRWRALACAILTGGRTVARDNPQLTVRGVNTPRQPLRVILDSKGEIPANAKVLADENALLVYGKERPWSFAAPVEAISVPDSEGRIDLRALMEILARRGINEVHVEAGARMNGALLRAGRVDEVIAYFAPTLIGDRARGMFDLPEMTSLGAAARLDIRDARMIERDLRVIARVVWNV